jgi:3-deoxy-manno-octulosonate cytidylyltransferase (CMP-KDO synthetase)
MSAPRTAIVLPARFASTRFPGKPLAVINGHPLIEWVYRRASEIKGVDRIVVATDDDRIASVVRAFGGDVAMTSRDHATGTDRVAEVARGTDHDIIVNLQGDEPVFSPALIETMIAVAADTDADIVTACHVIRDRDEIANPHVVKVVRNVNGNAMYFSRLPIPHCGEDVLRHIGVYVFKRDALFRFTEAARTPLEQAESLEQLRALENGMTINVVVTDDATVGVDVPDDIKNVEKALGSALD